MKKEMTINVEIKFPEYEDMKEAIKECKRKWDKDDFQYSSDITYINRLIDFPGGCFRIYASEDTGFKPTFDEIHGRYLYRDKKFDLNKKGYRELIEYAMSQIQNVIKPW